MAGREAGANGSFGAMEIKTRIPRPRGKKNNNILRLVKGRPILVTNPETRKQEAEIAEILAAEAEKAGWPIPLDEYVEMDLEYDATEDVIIVTVRRTGSSPPQGKWGGRVDIQNMVDTVADALEERRGHKGIVINDNRVSYVSASRAPLIEKKRHDRSKREKKR